MKLADVIDSIHVKHLVGTLQVDVTGVHYDSRRVEAGGLFCALQGGGRDGHDYIEAALENGAVAILSERPNPAAFAATWLQVGDARAAMGLAAANFEGQPSLEFPVIGVTGTNGKTTTACLIHHLLQSVLHRAGLLGTIHYSTGDAVVAAPHTTPESPDLQHLLREMRERDCRAAVMEVSSHGLAQHRVTGVSFDVGIFTNLTQDHLDYHRTMDSYFEAKRALFEQIDRDSRKKGAAILNIDDVYGDRLNKIHFEGLTKYTYGRSANADFQAGAIRSDFNGTQFKLTFKERQFLVRIPLIGVFNVYNAVAAIASAYAIGCNLREVIAKMSGVPQVPGRLEAVGDRQINYRVFVDYAHTPDALANVLETLRALEPTRLITVFGCGGDRDMTKRAPMAATAEKLGDFCILTSDNPRTEDPRQILDDAAEGFLGSDHEIIEDRRAAIRHAIQMAGERDIILIAGKGHETYQEINGVRHDFDDRKIASACIAEKAEGGGR
ncbi:MAG: UDP-N-acetylmuramoyl-L-alanyl-D-glutamate--2,6-diaminopimelate ligase [Verrucomicrobiaceae bacterium]|nr:UDP-N-acetylmuramoyl-L-alanyl-D-glutamate--2,6-diaminopimelate ligase [Verrucomicrobiaceae bacterium]